jgi:hypothetical protein
MIAIKCDSAIKSAGPLNLKSTDSLGMHILNVFRTGGHDIVVRLSVLHRIYPVFGNAMENSFQSNGQDGIIRQYQEGFVIGPW